MRVTVATIGVVGLCGAVMAAQGGGRQGGRAGGEGGGTTILEPAPADRVVAMPKEKLAQYLKDMDAKKQQTLRMLEGGKYNVNIRRITNAETALIHPNTIDVWYVMEGGGTLTTGGKIEGGKIVGGESHAVKVGDVEFIPANLPHGVSGVNGNITWLNVRWDVDWAPDAELGAGNLPGRPAARGEGGGEAGAGRAAGAPPAGRAAGAPGGRAGAPVGRGLGVLEYAATDHAVHISKEQLDAYRMDMDAKNTGTLRMIEGGHFNVNIRRIKAPSVEFHPLTIDTWVVLEGGGTANSGFERANGRRVEGTGVSAPASLADVFFVPANFTHGFSAVNEVMAWLNIRWDTNWPAKK